MGAVCCCGDKCLPEWKVFSKSECSVLTFAIGPKDVDSINFRPNIEDLWIKQLIAFKRIHLGLFSVIGVCLWDREIDR